MATNKTSKVPQTAKEPVATQTTLKVETEAKKATPVQADTKKEAPVVEKKETAKETKPAAKKTTTRRTTARKTATKRTTAKKPVGRPKKTVIDVKPEVFVQFAGSEYSESDIMKKVVAAWEAEDKKPAAIKRVKLYVKPEDGKAYYVINEGLKNGSTGGVDL